MSMTLMRMNLYNETLANISRSLALSKAPPPDEYYANKQYIEALQCFAIFLGVLLLIFFVNQYRWLKVLKLPITAPETDQNNVVIPTELQVDELDKMLTGENMSGEMKTLLLNRVLSLGSLNKPVQSNC